MGVSFTVPLAAMSLLSAAGLAAIILFSLVRAALLRQSIENAAERRREDFTALQQLKDDVDEQQRGTYERRSRRQRQIHNVEELKHRVATARADRLELVHELGEPGAGGRLFRAELTIDPAFLTDRADEVLVNPQIWKVHNVAEVWTADSHVASDAILRAFPVSSGIRVGALRGADGSAPAPASTAAATAQQMAVEA